MCNADILSLLQHLYTSIQANHVCYNYKIHAYFEAFASLTQNLRKNRLFFEKSNFVGIVLKIKSIERLNTMWNGWLFATKVIVYSNFAQGILQGVFCNLTALFCYYKISHLNFFERICENLAQAIELRLHQFLLLDVYIDLRENYESLTSSFWEKRRSFLFFHFFLYQN